MARIGIFGGTFNPVHLGHSSLVNQIKKEKKLDQVLIIPTNRPPHKSSKGLASNYDRFTMCQKMFHLEDGYLVSDIEFRLGGESYTVRTLQELYEEYSEDSLYLIMGSDMIFTFDLWKDYLEILRLASIVVGARSEQEFQSMKKKADELVQLSGGSVEVVPIEVKTMSSTLIRERLAAGYDCSQYLDPAVEQYIRDHHLYQQPEINWEQLSNSVHKKLTNARWHHTKYVVNMADKLAKIHGGDRKKARLAALLHDVMKNESDNSLLQYFRSNGIILTDIEKSSPPLWHSIAGAVYIKQEFQIYDYEIICAVRYHTTARAQMSLLEKIVYVADCVSKDRTYDGVEKGRELAEKNLDQAILYSLKHSLAQLIIEQKPLHPDSIQAYNSLIQTVMEVH